MRTFENEARLEAIDSRHADSLQPSLSQLSLDERDLREREREREKRERERFIRNAAPSVESNDSDGFKR